MLTVEDIKLFIDNDAVSTKKQLASRRRYKRCLKR